MSHEQVIFDKADSVIKKISTDWCHLQ